MTITVKLNEAKIKDKVTNDKFGLMVASEWKRLIQPYEPRDTNTMSSTAKIYPFTIHYIQPYSSKVYYGKNFNFQHKNPYSTYEWDIAAANAGQTNKLYRTINNHLGG